jgi:hypothetical protein
MIETARQQATKSAPPAPIPLAFEVVEAWKLRDDRRYEEERYGAMTDADPARRSTFERVKLLNLRTALLKHDSTNLPLRPPPARVLQAVAPGKHLIKGELLDRLHPIDEELDARGIGRHHPAYLVCFDLLRAEMLATVEARLRHFQFPSSVPQQPSHTAAPFAPVPVSTIIDAWSKERRPQERTIYQWTRVIKKLTDFVGHDGAARITRTDITRWKDHLIEEGRLAHETVENDLIVVRSIFRYAYQSMHISTNPAEFVVFKAKDDPKKDKRAYSDGEARAVLTKARGEDEPHKRCVPWLATFTGARCDELCGTVKAMPPCVVRLNARIGDTDFLSHPSAEGL